MYAFLISMDGRKMIQVLAVNLIFFIFGKKLERAWLKKALGENLLLLKGLVFFTNEQL